MARNRRSCFHSSHTKEDGGMQMFLGMCNDTTSQKVQEPSTGMAFDKMCCIQCATCRFIHTNFYNLCIQRQTCYFRNLLIMFLHSKKKKKRRQRPGEQGSLLLKLVGVSDGKPWKCTFCNAPAPLIPILVHPSQPMAHLICAA